MTGDQAVRTTERAGGVWLLELCRPERRNALDAAAVDGLVDALVRFEADEQARVLVITGQGAAFCAGGDLDEIAAISVAPSPERRDYLWRHIQRIPRALARIDKPVVAAVNGAARGAGFDLALMCDLRLASRSASFAESYIRLGLVAGDGGAFHLARLAGTARSLDLLWTGRTIGAEEAYAFGLLNEVVDDEGLLERALALAAMIASQPSEAVRMTKRAVYAAKHVGLAEHLDLVASHMAVLYDSDDFRSRMGNAGRSRAGGIPVHVDSGSRPKYDK